MRKFKHETDFASSPLSPPFICPPHSKVALASLIWPCISACFSWEAFSGVAFWSLHSFSHNACQACSPHSIHALKKHVLKNHLDPEKIVTELAVSGCQSFASWPHGITVILTFTIIPLLVICRPPIAWFADGVIFQELYFYCYCVNGII